MVRKGRDLVGGIAGATELSFRTDSGSGGNAIDLEIAGRDVKKLEEVSQKIQDQFLFSRNLGSFLIFKGSKISSFL